MIRHLRLQVCDVDWLEPAEPVHIGAVRDGAIHWNYWIQFGRPVHLSARGKVPGGSPPVPMYVTAKLHVIRQRHLVERLVYTLSCRCFTWPRECS